MPRHNVTFQCLSLATLTVFVLGGCVLPPAANVPPAPPAPPTKYYVASVDTASSESAESSQEGLKTLDDRAKSVLRPGITVAFFPPDQCRNISAADTKATKEEVEMANNCGVLISALENSVAGQYSVVSWQTLKPRAIGDDPFKKAEDRKVDVVFEVDSFGMNALGQDASSNLRIDFAEQTNASDRTPLVIEPTALPVVGNRCKAGVESIQSTRAQAGMVGSFTGAIKAVEVSSGRALAYYQRTLTDDPGEESSSGYDLYFRADPKSDYVAPYVPPPTYNGLQKAGVALTVVGSVMVVAGGVLRFTAFRPETGNDGGLVYNQPGTGLTAGMFLSGFFVAGGGVAMLVMGNRKAKRTPPPAVASAEPNVTYPPPADVLCVQPSSPPWLQATPQWTAPPAAGSSSFSISSSATAGVDAARERENRLRKLVIDDFAQQLVALSSK